MLLARPAQAAAQGSGVLLVVAIQHFHAESTAKALLVSAVFVGLLMSPLAVNIVGRWRLAASRALSLMLAGSAACVGLAAASRTFPTFFVGVMLGVILVSAATPFVTSIWRQNVPSMLRGRLFSIANSAAGVAGVLSALLIGAYLGGDASRYQLPLGALAILLLGAAVASAGTPSRPIRRHARNPLAVLAFLWRHPAFGAMSAAWMLVGLGNLATLPLRTEYIASGNYGPALPAGLVLVITAAIPQATALVTTMGWGRLFDRVRFPVLRLAINTCFALSIVAYFGPSLWRQILGSLLLGLAQGGGMVTWNLWVTKYATPERTADYMAVHTFLTGLRGIVAPLLAYAVLDALSLYTAAWLGVTFNICSCLVLGLIILYPPLSPKRRRTARQAG